MSAKTCAASPAHASCRCWWMPTPAGAAPSTSPAPARELITRRRRRHAPRGPGGGQALRPPARQGAGAARRRWSTASRPPWMRRTRCRLRHHGAHRCACGGRPGRRRSSAPQAYVAAGADMIFAEALTTLEEYRAVHRARCRVPVLANITEFGKTPLFTTTELGARRRAPGAVSAVGVPRDEQGGAGGVRRASAATARRRASSTCMQTRAELYDVLGYHDYERKLDELFGERQGRGADMNVPTPGSSPRNPSRSPA